MAQRHDEGRPIRGTAPGNVSKRARIYEADRTCGFEGCATKLSIYNRTDSCWQHEAPRRFVLHPGGRPRKDRHVAA